MQVANVARVLYFRHQSPNSAPVLAMDEFRRQYGFEPDGVNFYISLSSGSQETLASEGRTGLNVTHEQFFEEVISAPAFTGQQPKFVILRIEPLEAHDPFGFVNSNLKWVANVAEDLNRFQETAVKEGKRLDIVIRYASEMNDRGNQDLWSEAPGVPGEFCQSEGSVSRPGPEHSVWVFSGDPGRH